MRQSVHLFLFVAVCGVHAFYAIAAAGAVSAWASWPLVHELPVRTYPLFTSVPATIAAILLGFVVVAETEGQARLWLKAALVFVMLDPIAWWTIFWPNATRLACIGQGCYSATAIADMRAATVDMSQAQAALAIVACAALVCAVHATMKLQQRAVTN